MFVHLSDLSLGIKFLIEVAVVAGYDRPGI